MSRHSTNPWIVLVIICLAQFMVILDATIVNVALPHIQTALSFSNTSLQWIINAYTLVFAGFLLLGGRAGDLLGRKRLFLIGLVISTAFAEGKERARALGVWAAIAIGGSAFGLVLGGWLTQSFSWRWIFFVNV